MRNYHGSGKHPEFTFLCVNQSQLLIKLTIVVVKLLLILRIQYNVAVWSVNLFSIHLQMICRHLKYCKSFNPIAFVLNVFFVVSSSLLYVIRGMGVLFQIASALCLSIFILYDGRITTRNFTYMKNVLVVLLTISGKPFILQIT